MKPSVDKLLQDVQLLSQRMRQREKNTDELITKTNKIHHLLNGMQTYQEDALNYSDIASRAENHPRRRLILCLAAENKQLEQLKLQNQTLEASLEDHQSTLEMIMSKYREQMNTMMHTQQVENRIKLNEQTLNEIDGKQWTGTPNLFYKNNDLETSAVNDRMSMMAAISQEVVEQSDKYSAELETEIYRLKTENNGLRNILSISSLQFNPDNPFQFRQTEEEIEEDNKRDSNAGTITPTVDEVSENTEISKLLKEGNNNSCTEFDSNCVGNIRQRLYDDAFVLDSNVQSVHLSNSSQL